MMKMPVDKIISQLSSARSLLLEYEASTANSPAPAYQDVDYKQVDTLITDVTLMAYADDELEPRAQRAVIEALTRDPELARRVNNFQSTRASLARLYYAPMHEPLPERLAALLRDEG
jgi:hypothetical protein